MSLLVDRMVARGRTMTVLKCVAFLHLRTGSMIAWRTRMFMSAPLNPSVAWAISLMS